MRTRTGNSMMVWLTAVLLVALAVGCGDRGGQDNTIPTIPTATTVSSVTPLTAATGVPINTKKISVAFSKPMNPLTITTATFTLACPAGTAITGTVGYAANGNVATFTPGSDLPANTLCTATLTTGVKDTAGNALDTPFTWTFTTGATADTTPPTVSSTVPLANATNVALNTRVTASFSEAMDLSLITTATFTLACPAGTAITGTTGYAVNGNVATFTPASNLPASTLCTATIKGGASGVKDVAGNALAVDKVWTFTTGAAPDTTAPTVSSTNPIAGAVGVCNNKTINATFSEPMDPLTITTDTFTLAVTAGASVNGVVAYDPLTNIATFNPDADLTGTPATSYTATIKGGASGVKDVAGNALASNKVWTFTTGATTCQTPVPLGSSSNFAILASAAITNIPTSAITGDIGLTPDAGSNISGFSVPATCPEVTGKVYAVDATGPACALIAPVLLTNAKTDAGIAFTNARAAVRGTPIARSGNLNGLTLYPGLYESGTSLEISPGGFLYLDAQGDVNAVFVIRSATTITTQSTSEVVLSGGAKATNVYWTAGSAVTLGTNSKMKGNLIAGTAISLLTGANLEGRALNQGAAAAAITLDSNTITVPSP